VIEADDDQSQYCLLIWPERLRGAPGSQAGEDPRGAYRNAALQASVRKPVLQTDCAERAVSEIEIGFLTALQHVL
jgi:hypothetical protein